MRRLKALHSYLVKHIYPRATHTISWIAFAGRVLTGCSSVGRTGPIADCAGPIYAGVGSLRNTEGYWGVRLVKWRSKSV
jgi:hypothetical protein